MNRRILHILLAVVVLGAAFRSMLADREMLVFAKTLLDLGKLDSGAAAKALSLAQWGAALNWLAVLSAAILGLRR